MGIVRGQTNAPQSASVPFSYSGARDPNAVGLIENQAHFVGPAGLKTGVQVAKLPTRRASWSGC